MPRFVRPTTPMSAHEEDVLYMLNLPLAQAILHELAKDGPRTSAQLAEAVRSAPSTVGFHLGRLETAGLISADVPAGQRAGRRVRYAVRVDGVVDAVDTLLAYLLSSNDYSVERKEPE